MARFQSCLISGGFSAAYERLLPDFGRMSGIKVSTGSGSAQGTGQQTIGALLARAVAPEIQFIQTFAAAVVAGSRQMQDARRLIEFLSSARASEAIRSSGMEPLATAR
jgi:ABC-type molybdate transport system substrate-binding protein